MNDQCGEEAKAKKETERALELVHVDKSYLYAVFSVSNKSVREEWGWGITMLWDHLCNAKSHS